MLLLLLLLLMLLLFLLMLLILNIGSVTAEILMMLSSRWWWWWWWGGVGGGGVKSFSCQTQLLLCWVELSCSWLGVVTIIQSPKSSQLNTQSLSLVVFLKGNQEINSSSGQELFGDNLRKWMMHRDLIMKKNFYNLILDSCHMNYYA